MTAPRIRQACLISPRVCEDQEHDLLRARMAMMAGLQLVDAWGWFVIIPEVAQGCATPHVDTRDLRREIIEALDPKYDCVVMLTGWMQSPSAIQDRYLALRLGIPALTIEQALSQGMQP